MTVRIRPTVAMIVTATMAVVTAGCADDDGNDPATSDSSDVTFVAGGGENEASAEATAAADVRIGGRVTDLAESPDGAIWGVIDDSRILSVADGEAWAVTPTFDGADVPVADIAVGADSTVYVLAADPQPGEPVVFTLGEGGELQPAFGRAASGDDLTGAAPLTADGSAAPDALLGPVVDIAAGEDGSVTFAEQVVPGGLSAVNLVRRVVDGEIVTVAGGAPATGTEPTDAEVIEAAFTDVTTARDLPVLGVAYIAVDGSDTYVQLFNAVLRIDADGAVTRILGSRDNDAETLPTSQGPFAESLPGTDLDFRGNLDVGPSAADGAVLAMAIGAELTDDQIESFGWSLDGGSAHAADVASAAAAAAEQQSAVLVGAEGDATIAGLIGTDALLTGEGDIVAAGWDFESGESVIVRYPAE